jgi:DHA1 family tetracycline resistance protein-like MFS transporter
MGHYQSLRDSLDCDAMCVGSMTSVRSTLALVGSTIIGRASDSKTLDNTLGGARRAFLILGVLAAAIELAIASQATSITMLWMSMVPSALFQQNFNVLKALYGEYHGPSATAAERAGSAGKLGMAVGLAFMIGPLLSSILFSTLPQAALFASVCLGLAMAFLVLLPRPPTDATIAVDEKNSKIPSSSTGKGESIDDVPTKSMLSSFLSRLVPDLVPAARTPPAIFIMVSRICMALAFHIFQTIWAVALRERFNFGPKDYGRYYGFIGFGFAMSQGLFAKVLLEKYGSTDRDRTRLLLVCAVLLGGGRLCAYLTNDLVVVYVLFWFIITALGVINTIFTADTTKIANPNELGGLFGVLGSVESLAGIVGPILGGTLAKIHPIQGPLVAVVGLYGIVFVMVYRDYERLVCQSKLSIGGEVSKNVNESFDPKKDD